MAAKYRNLLVVGCGPHYQKRYHPVIEKDGLTIPLLIDLEANREAIIHFFQNRKIKPNATLFLHDSLRNTVTPEQIDAVVKARVNLSMIDAVIICTEPKAHKAYALWAFLHRLPVFMDKPPCAFHSQDKIDTLLSDFEEMAAEAEKKSHHVVVSCERRAHLGYQWVKGYLKNFIREEKQPITSVDIHFANGNWVTAEEYRNQEQHPFKYGYGLLLHSGYHYIDLLVTLLGLNPSRKMKYRMKILHSCHKGLGEKDFLLIGQAEQNEKLITHFSLKLLNTSLSRRRNFTYSPEAEWRMRQEHVIIHLGYLASVQVRSNPLKKLSPETCLEDDFNILAMHSPLLNKRRPFIQIRRPDLSKSFSFLPKAASLNKFAREWQLKEFLEGRDGNSPLSSHWETMRLIQQIYSRMGHSSFVMSQGRVREYPSSLCST